jgi:tripartite-type tricarboxylate transporter receptor subunit TctC
MTLNRTLRNIGIGILMSVPLVTASAQDAWPTKPLNVIISYSAGGATDVVTRLVMTELSAELGQPIIIENKPGANSNIAASMVARSQPDGYTILASGSWFLINQFMETGRTWEHEDFAPVARVGLMDNILAVPASSPAKTLKDYVEMAAAAKDKPLQYGSPGTGSTQRMAVEMFANAAGIKVEAVQYKGAPPILPDLIANRLSMTILAASNVTGLVKAGKLRALASAGEKRGSGTPNLPTMIESGYADVVAESWFGFHVRAGTPPSRIKKLSDAMKKVLAKPEVQAQLAAADTETAFLDSQAFAKSLENERKRWEAVAKSIAN